MNALQQLRESGLSVELVNDGDNVLINPPPPKAWVPRLVEAKPQIIAELKQELAALQLLDDSRPSRPCEFINPLPNPDVTKLAKAFYDHIMGEGVRNNCCYAPRNRYCEEGRRLRDAYRQVCS